MNKILASIIVSLSLITAACAEDKTEKKEPETKMVCVDKQGKDGKPLLDKKGKVQQSCMEVKIRKKLEGTTIPTK